MALIQELQTAKAAETKRKVIALKMQASKAGLLDYKECPSCTCKVLALAQVDNDAKKTDMYKKITLNSLDDRDPIALVCTECGLIIASMVRDTRDITDGVITSELVNLE